MTEIATYRCNNRACMRTIYLGKNFPVWKSDTPKDVRTLAVTPHIEMYVERYRSERYCDNCKKAVEPTAAASCPTCSTPSLVEEQTGRACVQCTKGVFLLQHLAIR